MKFPEFLLQGGFYFCDKCRLNDLLIVTICFFLFRVEKHSGDLVETEQYEEVEQFPADSDLISLEQVNPQIVPNATSKGKHLFSFLFETSV